MRLFSLEQSAQAELRWKGTRNGRLPYLDEAPHLANCRRHGGLRGRHDDLFCDVTG
jgi:hypothetical protein